MTYTNRITNYSKFKTTPPKKKKKTFYGIYWKALETNIFLGSVKSTMKEYLHYS